LVVVYLLLLPPPPLLLTPPPPSSTLFPYTTLFRSRRKQVMSPWADRKPCKTSANSSKNTTSNSSSLRSPTYWANPAPNSYRRSRSEEHTSELQSRFDLVCRLLLEKKKITREHQQGT